MLATCASLTIRLASPYAQGPEWRRRRWWPDCVGRAIATVIGRRAHLGETPVDRGIADRDGMLAIQRAGCGFAFFVGRAPGRQPTRAGQFGGNLDAIIGCEGQKELEIVRHHREVHVFESQGDLDGLLDCWA